MKYQGIPIQEHERKVEEYFLKLENSKKNYGIENELKDISTILLCFVNRSGSTFVASLLGKMGLCGKMFEQKNYEFFNHNIVISYSKEHKIKNLPEYAQKVASNFCTPTGFFTTKLSAGQAFWLTKREIIGNLYKKPLFIYLKRKNIVAQAISLSIAHQNMIWTSKVPKLNVELVFKPQDIVSKMLLISRIYALFDLYFSLHSIEPIIVYYEDVVNDVVGFKNQLQLNLNIELTLDCEADFMPEKQSTNLNLEWEKRIREMYNTSNLERNIGSRF